MQLSNYARNVIDTSGEFAQEKAYWLNQLAGDLVTSGFMPTRYHSGPVEAERATYRFTLPAQLAEKVVALGKGAESAIFIILTAGVNYLLYRYTDNRDVLIGTPIFKKEYNLQYLNKVLALRTQIDPEMTVKEFLGVVKKTVQEANKFQNYPFENLVQHLDLPQDVHGTVLHTFVRLQQLQDAQFLAGVQTDVSFHFSLETAGLECCLEYRADLFFETDMQQLARHYIQYLESVLAQPEIRLREIEVLSPAEKEQLIHGFNHTESKVSASTIHQLVEERANLCPEKVALRFQDTQMTYRELNREANQLARLLRAKGVGRNHIVALSATRSLRMVVAMLAVLKAGGGYLPIDPDYPAERIRFMLDDSKASVLLTQSQLVGELDFGGEVILLDQVDLTTLDGANLENINATNDLLYLIYTSGSTGQPKGVMLEHQNLVNLLHFQMTETNLDYAVNVLQFTNISFDVSFQEIFATLVAGGTLCIPERAVRENVQLLFEFIRQEEIQLVHFPASFLKFILNEAEYMEHFPTGIKHIVSAGEQLIVTAEFKNYLQSNQVYLHNHYGPSESHVVTTLTIDPAQFIPELPGIGKPITNTSIYILNSAGQCQPVGVAGELYIAGDSVGRGYWQRAELTSERFIPSPFKAGERMYKTGDLARWQTGGTIEFLGRIDNQVKIRGFRVELGEIERQLLNYAGIKEALVIDRVDEKQSSYLCAYLVAEEDLGISEVREYLSQKLPQYMIPTYFVKLDRIPLTPNKKVDRKALPEPQAEQLSRAKYVAPTTEMELQLAQVWQDVLGVADVGIHDNFFELGGDSIKAIQISARLQKNNLKLVINDLFQNPTIARVLPLISGYEQKVDQGMVQGEVQLTPIQRWFFEQQFAEGHHWNQAVMLYRRAGFLAEVVREVIAELVRHHDALRMTFNSEASHEVRQYNRNTSGDLFDLTLLDLTQVEEWREQIEEEVQRIQRSIKLETGPLVKIGLFKTREGDHLLMAIHHLVIDGISWRILFEDFAVGYNQALKGEAVKFQDKTTSYQEWAEKLSQYSNQPAILQELAYWQAIANEPVPALPKDHLPATNRRKDGRLASIRLTQAETEMLQKKVNRAYNTEINDILLTALGLTLKDWSKSEKVLINLEGHGREEFMDVEIQRTVGWFTSMHPVLLDFSRADQLKEQIIAVKESLRQIPNKGTGYWILKYLTAAEQKCQAQLAVNPEVNFNYLGQFDQNVDTSIFEISPLGFGDTVSPESALLNHLAVSGLIFGGELVLNFNYNALEYEEATITHLVENFKVNLLQIIEHCAGQEETEFTPGDFTTGLSQEDFAEIKRHVREEVGEGAISKIYPLTPMQEGILFHGILEKQYDSYFIQFVLSLKGQVDLAIFEESVNRLIEHFEVLRTVFVYDQLEKPWQVVLAPRRWKLTFEDCSNLNPAEQLARLTEYKAEDRQRGFDLTRDILTRVTIFKMDAQSYQVVWDLHHIVVDGWSLSIILKHFLQIYGDLQAQRASNFAEKANFSDFVAWLEEQETAEAGVYWEQYLADYAQLASVPRGESLAGSTLPVDTVSFSLAQEHTGSLMEMAKKNQVTIHTILQVIWGLILQRYNYSDDVVFGMVVSGRAAEIKGIESMVGTFINTIPIRISSTANQTVGELLRTVQNSALCSEKYSYYPLVKIQSRSGIRNLFDHVVNFQNFPIEEEVKHLERREELGFVIDDIDMAGQANYDFNLIITPGPELNFKIRYKTAAYAGQFIAQVAEHILITAERLISGGDGLVRDIEIITPGEKAYLAQLHGMAREIDYRETYAQRFQAAAEKHPDNIALVCHTEQLTYREVNERANQLAWSLRERGVGAGSLVGLFCKRSLDMVIGLLGILKAGGAYLPLDPDYPEERIQFMLADSGVSLLLTQAGLQKKVPGDVECLDLTGNSAYSVHYANPPALKASQDLAYVIYTSGSTGKPKGVMIEERALSNFITGMLERINFEPGKSILSLTTICFDIFVLESLVPLTQGMRVVIGDEAMQKDPQALQQVLASQQIDLLQMTPSRMQIFLSDPANGAVLERLSEIMLGGEPVPLELVKRLQKLTSARLFNMYGPTETTVWSTVEDLTGADVVYLGKAITNTQLYIVDQYDHLQPLGMAGELCIAGAGLARGYLHQPELTATKFQPNPFTPGERMYRTGDLVRLLPDRGIQFIGRRDHQVKIRGYRIELGEIENTLRQHPGVKEVAVLVQEDQQGDKYLVAYVTSDEVVSVSDYRDYLLARLPAYMVPSYIMQIEAMPLTPNGKLNREALPEPGGSIYTGVVYAEPCTAIEVCLAHVWEEVLHITAPGINDNFFDLGGHSLRATILVSKIRKELGIEVPLSVFFERPTIKELAEYIQQAEREQTVEITRLESREYTPLAPAQKGLYTLYQLDPESTSYNMSLCLRLAGKVDVERLTQAFRQLIARHETLRTSFTLVDEQIVQQVHPEVTFQITTIDQAGKPIAQLIDEFVRPFKLEQAPLLRVQLVKHREDLHYLLIDRHHIITDGYSTGILMQEFASLYRGEDLPAPELQYIDYVAWQLERLAQGELQKQEGYWLNCFRDVPTLYLPTDFARPQVQAFQGERYGFLIEPEQAEWVKALARKTGTTLFMVLLSAFNILLAKYSGQDEIVVGSSSSGRVYSELNQINGLFANTLALRNQPKGSLSFTEFLLSVRKQTLEAFENQEYPFERLVHQLNLQRDVSHNPLFDVTFDLFNLEVLQIDLEELTLTPELLANKTAKFDLTLLAAETREGIECYFEYRTDLFARETIEQMADNFLKILHQVLATPEKLLYTIQCNTRSANATDAQSNAALNVEFEL